MSDILGICDSLLVETSFSTRRVRYERDILLFENTLVLGFLIAYPDPDTLLANWVDDSSRAISTNQFSLRRAGEKAWNAYVILLATADSDYAQATATATIEEDLTGTRKIVRCGVKDSDDARAALLPLLPLQSSPRLDSVNIPAEIRERTTELPPRAIEAFLSAAEDSVVVQILEEAT